MNCPRCNAKVAFTKDRCDNCGQKLVEFRKIVSLSNVCYNQGLSQAKVRDLSGAVVSLKQSLQYNKLNTSARNLLGLVYYEQGELVAALSEWVISKNFQEKNNDADRYIQMMQSNPNKLESYNQAIKKYNSALFSAKHGDEDMAIIQLKKVVSVHPNFIKAQQLLALLYMMTEKKENRVRAYKILKHISKIDVNNTTTLSFLKELSDVQVKNDSPVRKAETTTANTENRKTLPRVDVDAYRTITPYKEDKPSVLPFVNVLVGIIIGLAIMYCLILPHMKTAESEKENKNFKQYSEQQATADSDVTTLKNENKKLQAKVDELTASLEELQGGDVTDSTTLLENYNIIFEAAKAYMNGKVEKAAEKLVVVDTNLLNSEAAQDLYKKISAETFADASENYFEQGRDAYNGEGDYAGAKDYDKAVELLEKSLEYNPDNTDAMYFLGRCYQQQSDAEKAKEYYKKIIENYPDSGRYSEASSRLRELGE